MASDIKLVFHSSTIATMHGPINFRLYFIVFSPRSTTLLYKGVPRKFRSSHKCSTNLMCLKTSRQAPFPAKTCIFLLSAVFDRLCGSRTLCFPSGKANGYGDNLSASTARLRPHVCSPAREHIVVVNKAPGLRYLYISARSNVTEAVRFRREMNGFRKLLLHI